MKIYKTDDNWFFLEEEAADNHVKILNSSMENRIEELKKEAKDTGIDNSSVINAILGSLHLYEEIDTDNPETILEFLQDYRDLKSEIEAIKEWVHMTD